MQNYFVAGMLSLLFGFLLSETCFSQVAEPTTVNLEQQVETLATATETEQVEDDSYVQEMRNRLSHPININNADEEELSLLNLLTALEINSILQYRSLLGKFVDVYELQAVPGMDMATLRNIRPFVTVSEEENLLRTVRQRFKGGSSSLLFRLSQVPERSKGYGPDSGTTGSYKGSPQKIFLRYRYTYKNVLSVGILGEKDAGEQFFKAEQRQGFDFYSFHCFTSRIGIIRSLAIGDFTVSMGQGLTQWQSFAFNKSAAVLNIKRQAAVLHPYASPGEINFHRGAGITLQKGHWQTTAFVSFRKMDANFVADSVDVTGHVSSIQSSGYHRTQTEITDKGILKQFAWGGNIGWQDRQFHAGLNLVRYQFSLPVIKSAAPYNIYALSGPSLSNYSIDYSYTFKNLHFFGETAIDNHSNPASLNGLLIALSATVDMSFLYRHISPAYQSLNSNAFTENTSPNNERGFYAGISMRPCIGWRIDAYADLVRFPWLKFRTDAISTSQDLFVQLSYQPNKLFDMYSRFRAQTKGVNSKTAAALGEVLPVLKQQWATAFNYRIEPGLEIKGRSCLIWYGNKGDGKEAGWLLSVTALYQPLQKRYSGTAGINFFETDGYNSRLYQYESDVLYSFSTPVLYGKGSRYMGMINYKANGKWMLSIRFAGTLYRGQIVVGSGADEIRGRHKSEIKIQAMFIF